MSFPANNCRVDDTIENLQLLEDLLTERGYHVRTAPRGSLALGSIRVESEIGKGTTFRLAIPKQKP